MDELNYKPVNNDEELNGAFEVRRRVFVEEQGVSEDVEIDGHDREALHMVVEEEGRVIGTARVMFLAEGKAKIERMAIMKLFRRRGIGRNIIFFLLEELRSRQVKQVILYAQYSVIDFYRSCGFEESGLPFWEAGIKHVKMQKKP